MKTLLFILLLTPLTMQNPKSVTQNGMQVSWHYADQRLWIEMQAPTSGWLAIGFNQSHDIVGNYLLMGRIRDGRAELVEHATLAVGTYRPISQLGGKIQVQDLSGWEKGGSTYVRFSLPIQAIDAYRKDLSPGSKQVLLLAFSREDDFQHHSMMRTALDIQL